MSKYNFFYKLEKKFLRIWLIILDAELPLGSLHTVQRLLSCLSASSPKRLQILFSQCIPYPQNPQIACAVAKFPTSNKHAHCIMHAPHVRLL